jgi:hypothetical protein
MENISEIKDNTQEQKKVDEKIQTVETDKNVISETTKQQPNPENNLKEFNQAPKTTLLLDENVSNHIDNNNHSNNNHINSNNNMIGMLIYFVVVCIVGYFILKTDNIKYKIGFIVGFLFITFFIKKKFMTNNKTVVEDDGQNLIEG